MMLSDREAEVNNERTEHPAGELEREEDDTLWVFGYGSLCWLPGFDYKDSVLGHVTGFKRRFWQGNCTHRGTAAKPGRVATVVEEGKGEVWGRAFLVTGVAALPYLNQRECKLGGYTTRHALFHPVDASSSGSPLATKEKPFSRSPVTSLRLHEGPSRRTRQGGSSSPFCVASRYFNSGSSRNEEHPRTKPFPVTMYVATEGNCHWLGKAPLQSIADQIAECHGPSGSNADYLLNLAIFMRNEFPEVKDDHLFILERLVREALLVRGQGALGVGRGREEVQQFAARLPSKQLRCLKM